MHTPHLSVERVAIKPKPPLPTQVDSEALGLTPLEAVAVPGGAVLLVPASSQATPVDAERPGARTAEGQSHRLPARMS